MAGHRGYIHPVNLVFRSVFYNFLVAPLTWAAGSLWPIVFFQSLVLAYLIRLILREVFGDEIPLEVPGGHARARAC